MSVLVTGGAGYVGSHTTLALIQAGFDVVVLDNLCNSSLESLNRIGLLTGRYPKFVNGDITDQGVLKRLFAENPIDKVLHFAGLKSVFESVEHPTSYYKNNVYGSQVLIQAMLQAGVFTLVFSSSATVYGEPAEIPVSEACPVGKPSSPYGHTKLLIEDMLHSFAASDPRWKIAILRFFNPVGAHESGQIGESPIGIPNNLLPFITQVAVGKLQKLIVFGYDYPTDDGTGVRDYIHVMDLAEGHLRALSKLNSRNGIHTWNLGTGQGYSVLDMVRAFEKASGKPVPYSLAPRRPGDIPVCFADPTKAERELNWKATRGLDEIMRDAWRWQLMNPNGYD